MIAAGAVIGLTLAAVLGRLLATVLFGVHPLDPLTFAAVTIVLALTAAMAAAAPAWRATRIDPAVALAERVSTGGSRRGVRRGVRLFSRTTQRVQRART